MVLRRLLASAVLGGIASGSTSVSATRNPASSTIDDAEEWSTWPAWRQRIDGELGVGMRSRARGEGDRLGERCRPAPATNQLATACPPRPQGGISRHGCFHINLQVVVELRPSVDLVSPDVQPPMQMRLTRGSRAADMSDHRSSDNRDAHGDFEALEVGVSGDDGPVPDGEMKMWRILTITAPLPGSIPANTTDPASAALTSAPSPPFPWTAHVRRPRDRRRSASPKHRGSGPKRRSCRGAPGTGFPNIVTQRVRALGS